MKKDQPLVSQETDINEDTGDYEEEGNSQVVMAELTTEALHKFERGEKVPVKLYIEDFGGQPRIPAHSESLPDWVIGRVVIITDTDFAGEIVGIVDAAQHIVEVKRAHEDWDYYSSDYN